MIPKRNRQCYVIYYSPNHRKKIPSKRIFSDLIVNPRENLPCYKWENLRVRSTVVVHHCVHYDSSLKFPVWVWRSVVKPRKVCDKRPAPAVDLAASTTRIERLIRTIFPFLEVKCYKQDAETTGAFREICNRKMQKICYSYVRHDHLSEREGEPFVTLGEDWSFDSLTGYYRLKPSSKNGDRLLMKQLQAH